MSGYVPFAGQTHSAGGIAITPLHPGNIGRIAAQLAAMPPWSTTGQTAASLAQGLGTHIEGLRRFEIVDNGALCGMAAIHYPWLSGPYLQRLAVWPDFQGGSIGRRVLEWMETEARQAHARQLWLCVSTFNTRARLFYERSGFQAAAALDNLAVDGFDEILMRKRLAA